MAFTVAANITGLTDPGLQAAYAAGAVSPATPLARLARVFGWDRGSYDQALFKPPSPYADIDEGLAITPEIVDEVGTGSVTVAEKALGYSMGMTSFRTTPREILMANFAYLGGLFPRLIESMIADKLNNAEGTTTTIDGTAWGSSSHTTDAGSVDNLVGANLSFAHYATAVTILADQVDFRGSKMGGLPTALFHSTADRVLAQQILGALFSLGDDRTAVNVESGAVPVMSADLNANNWSVFSEPQFAASGRLAVPVVRGPAPKEIMEEEDTYRYKITDRLSLAVANPTNYLGSVIGQGS